MKYKYKGKDVTFENVTLHNGDVFVDETEELQIAYNGDTMLWDHLVDLRNGAVNFSVFENDLKELFEKIEDEGEEYNDKGIEEA